MRKTVPIEELKSGDVLDTGDPEVMKVTPEVFNSRKLVSAALAVPTHAFPVSEMSDRVHTVREVRKVGRMYAYVTMGTYAVVSLAKGSPVSVYRNGGNGPEDVSPAVVEASEPEPSGPTVSADGRTVTFRNVRVGDAMTVGLVPESVEPEPFSYIARQFRQLGPMENNHFRIKLTGERGGETKWLDISRDAVLSLLHMMQDEEFRSDKR